MDVKYIPSDWENTRSGIGNLIGLGAVGKGMIGSLKDISENLEDAQSAIAKYDVDGAISFSHTGHKGVYQGIYKDFKVLHDFAGKVGDIVDRTIDEPFYKDIDAFATAMRDLSITDVKTKNRIGAKETVVIPGEYGSNTMEVAKAEVSLEDLFSGSNAYAKQMKEEYDNWKLQNPDQELTEKDYEQTVLHSRAFQYDSIRDEQEKKEFWGQIASLAVIAGASIICPPAGMALGIAYGTLELESAVSGKDWISGRELGTGERVFRGVLAPLDIVPGVSGLSKFSSTVRLAHMGDMAELGLKTGLKAGIQRESRHVANMVIDAGKDSAARIRSAKAWAKEVPGKVKQKVADDIIDTARLMDSTCTFAKNILPSRQMGLLAEGVGSIRAPAENTHTVENGVKALFSKTDEGNVGSGLGNKGTVNKTDKIPDSVIRDGSHMSTDGALKPDVKYKAGEYEYLYETDNMGRLKEFNADDLKLTERDSRLPHKSNTPGKVTGDHAGHLAGDRFGGSPDLDNLVSQSSNVNLSKYKKLENQWATAIKEGKKVSVNVKVNYDGTGLRPTSFEIKYNIDGVIKKVKLNN
jgi:hypothetical protein